MRFLFTLLLLALPCAAAQTYVATAVDLCSGTVRQMSQPDMPGYPVSAEEFDPLLAKALDTCPKAIAEQPSNQWPHLDLA